MSVLNNVLLLGVLVLNMSEERQTRHGENKARVREKKRKKKAVLREGQVPVNHKKDRGQMVWSPESKGIETGELV